ncbi:MAG: hypothetical protein GX207_04630 [Peptococcaceae bacterium]|nr:hypothetical protein [Peptococcaceae bacterium]
MRYNYPEHFDSFCSDFARVIEEDIPMEIYFCQWPFENPHFWSLKNPHFWPSKTSITI